MICNASIALIGNPNSGKTTLFNRLTGLRQKVGNYPGVTVERKVGTLESEHSTLEIVDLPGTYSLSPKSEEERIAAETVVGLRPEFPMPNLVVCVVDASNFERSLYLLLQILEAGVPTVVALNMVDELEQRGGQLDVRRLSLLLNAPVFPISARSGLGVPELQKYLLNHAPQNIRHSKRSKNLMAVPNIREVQERQTRASAIARSVTRRAPDPHAWSERIDSVVLHPRFGPLVFMLMVLLVFQTVFSASLPLMSSLDSLFQSIRLEVVQTMPDTLFRSLLSDGILAGVGGVLVFLPQILLLFLCIGFLEHTGYMARAAFVMDRLMSRIGLQGKSFLPLLSSYACAVPGIMAARTIENRRDRLATIFIAPLMTCSARLPVYTLLIGAFIPAKPLLGRFLGLQAACLLSLYLLGFLAAILTVAVLKSSVLKSDPMPFLMEIPPYRLPTFQTVFFLMWDRTRMFLRRAGTVILVVSILVWCLLAFPRHPMGDDLRHSYAGQIGTFLEPVLKPLGFDWRIGVGLISAQAAREVIISTLATTYQVGDPGEDNTLRAAIQTHMTPLTGFSLLVWFAFALQCSATMAVARRETGGWPWPLGMFLYMTCLAYLGSFLVYQIGTALGYGG
jgi:ferrous iron transport protein B